MILADDGTIEDDIQFFAATIESKAKLAYDDFPTGWKITVAEPEARLSPSKLAAAGGLPAP